jgi:hypothetical protein
MDTDTHNRDDGDPAEEFIRELLQDRRGEETLAAPRLQPQADTARLVRYLCGLLPSQEADAVIGECAASRPARRRLIQVDSVLTSVRKQSLEAAATVSHGSDLAGSDLAVEVAAAWLEVCRERIPAVSRAASGLRLSSWRHLARQAKKGVEEAQAALAAFRSFARQLNDRLRSPAVAYSRGPAETEQGAVILGAPAGVEVTVEEVSVSPNGTFRVVVRARSDRDAKAEIDGCTVTVDITDGNTFWTLGSSVFEGMTATVMVEGIGRSLGLAHGGMPEQYVRVRLSDAPDEGQIDGPTPERPWLLPVREEKNGGGAPVASPVEIVGLPRWEDGNFSVDMRLPDAVRVAFSHCDLLLDAVVTDEITVNIGQWPVSDWADVPRTITTPSPLMGDVQLGDSSCLTVRLVCRSNE